MKHLKGQQCLFTKTCIETEVSWKSRVVNKNLQIFDVFAVFQDELEARITLKRLLFTTNIRSKYSKYSSERFFFQSRSENVERLFKFYTRSDHCLKSYKCASSDGINNARLHEHETRKKKFKCSIITQAYRSRCSSRESSSKARIAEDFSTILRIQQGEILRIASLCLKTMISY